LLSLSLIFWSSLAVAVVCFWWQSDKVKSKAIGHAYRYCKAQNIQLLDQSMVLTKVWPARTNEGQLCLKRHYRFEFASTGEERYEGIVQLTGSRLYQITVEPYAIASENDPLH